MQDLAGLLAKTFIARTDVKAVQNNSGEYMPVQHCTECGRGYCDHTSDKVREGWKRANIEAHLAGQKTFGHYLLNQKDQCKFFAFDIDLEDKGMWPSEYMIDTKTTASAWSSSGDYTGQIEQFSPRAAWLDRAHPARTWLKFQLRTVAHGLIRSIRNDLELPAACAYTGAKGLHVYALTGLIDAKDAREGAQIVLDSLASNKSLGGVQPTRGSNFFRFENYNAVTGQPNLMIELFPKQASLDGKDLGNLMRLPLGKNLKNPQDPTFFVDSSAALNELKPIDPVYALTTGSVNPFQAQGE